MGLPRQHAPLRQRQYIADQVAVMQAGSIVEYDASDAVLRRPQHANTPRYKRRCRRSSAAGPGVGIMTATRLLS